MPTDQLDRCVQLHTLFDTGTVKQADGESGRCIER